MLCVPSLPVGPDHTCCAAVGLPAHLHAGAQETEEESVLTALLTLQMHLSLSASMGTYAWGKYITDFTAYLHKNCYLKISKRKQKEAQNVVLVQQYCLHLTPRVGFGQAAPKDLQESAHSL